MTRRWPALALAWLLALPAVAWASQVTGGYALPSDLGSLSWPAALVLCVGLLVKWSPPTLTVRVQVCDKEDR